MSDITIGDVESKYGSQDPSLPESARRNLVRTAENIVSDVFGGRTGRQSEIEGDEDDFTAYLAAHLWEIAEGGELASQSQSGGSVNVDHLQTNIESQLSETRFGRVCLMMLRNQSNIGIIRADY